MRKTPETDAIAHQGLCESSYIAQMTELSRKIERERDEAREQNSKLLREFAKHSIMFALFGDSKEIKEGAK